MFRVFFGCALCWMTARPAFGAETFLDAYRKADRMRSPDDRLEFFTRAMRLWQSGDGKTLLASCRLERGRAEEALDRFRPAVADISAALALDPLAVEAYLERGRAYAALGKRGEALRDFKRYAAAKPDDLEGLLARADAYEELGRFKEANDDFVEAARRDSIEPRAPLGIGRCLARQGRCLEAVAYYDQALRMSGPQDPEILYFRGVCRDRAGQESKAREDLDAAIKGFQEILATRERSGGAVYRARETRLKLGKAYFERCGLRRREGERDGAFGDCGRACDLGYAAACLSARELAPAPKIPAAPAPPKPKYKSQGTGPGDRVYGH